MKLPLTADLQSCKWQCLMGPAHAAAVPEPGTALEALATSGAGSVELHYSYLFCPALQISTCLIIADRANPCGIAIIVWVQREESTETDWSTLLPQGAFLWALEPLVQFLGQRLNCTILCDCSRQETPLSMSRLSAHSASDCSSLSTLSCQLCQLRLGKTALRRTLGRLGGWLPHWAAADGTDPLANRDRDCFLFYNVPVAISR